MPLAQGHIIGEFSLGSWADFAIHLSHLLYVLNSVFPIIPCS
jgi:hypothetical protein